MNLKLLVCKLLHERGVINCRETIVHEEEGVEVEFAIYCFSPLPSFQFKFTTQSKLYICDDFLAVQNDQGGWLDRLDISEMLLKGPVCCSRLEDLLISFSREVDLNFENSLKMIIKVDCLILLLGDKFEVYFDVLRIVLGSICDCVMFSDLILHLSNLPILGSTPQSERLFSYLQSIISNHPNLGVVGTFCGSSSTLERNSHIPFFVTWLLDEETDEEIDQKSKEDHSRNQSDKLINPSHETPITSSSSYFKSKEGNRGNMVNFVGYHHMKEDLLFSFSQFQVQSNLLQQLPLLPPPSSVLLYGPPGHGKTLFVQWFLYILLI